MNEKNIAIAKSYYEAMHNKDLASFYNYLDENVTLISPFGTVQNKEAVLKAIESFFKLFIALNIDVVFGAGDKTVVIYDLQCAEPIGSLRASSLMTFKNNRIIIIELIYDTRPFI